MYFTASEQTPSLVSLGVLCEGGHVLGAGGILIQPLPGCCLCDLPLALASMSRARTRLSGWPACSTASAP